MNETKVLRSLYIVISLLLINVAATGYLAFSIATNSQRQIASPAGAAYQVAKDKAQALAKAVIERYNANDVVGLYSQFDALARMQFTQDKLADSVQKLHSLAGNVDDFAYSHTEAAGKRDGKEFLTLHYKVRLSGGVSPSGEMKLTVIQEGDKLGLFGFFVNALQQ